MDKPLVFVSALAFAALAHAESAPAPDKAPAPAVEKTRPHRLAVGPAFTRADYDLKVNGAMTNDFAPENLFGIAVEYGYRFGETSVGFHEVGAHTALLLGSTDNGPVTTALAEMPLLARYNYNFKLGDSTRLYVGPRLGFTSIALGIEDENTDFLESDSDGAASIGAGIGLRHDFSKRFGIALGYEYTRSTSTSFSLKDSGTSYDAKISSHEAHQVSLSAAWLF